MRSRLTLRQRVAVAYGMTGFVLSVAFAVVTTAVTEEYEHILIEAMLEDQARSAMERFAEDPSGALPLSESFSGYREADAPQPYRGLPSGLQELDLPGREGIHVAVFGEPGQRLVFVIDVGEIEILEQYLLQTMAAIVAGGTLLASWLGWVLARRTIQPVARLADEVSRLPASPVATRMAADYGGDEIGRLAAAIDAYQQKLVDAGAAETAFFGNASHELRTPIAVIQGAVEVMRDDPVASAGLLAKLGRIDRSVLELSFLLDALLLSARGLPVEREPIDVTEAAMRALRRVAVVEPTTSGRISVIAEGSLVVVASRRWVDCILTVLVQRVIAKAPGTTWRLKVTPTGVELTQPDGESTRGAVIQRSDLGLNLMFVERLCRGLGWRLDQHIGDDGALRVRLLVPTCATPSTAPAAVRPE